MNLKGKRFGKLIVLKDVGRSNHGSIKWLCKCDCGNEKTISAGNLASGATKSCGCLNNKLELKGKRFGRLVVLEDVGRSKNGSVKWLCKCDCGNEKVIVSYSLTCKRTKSCGCLIGEVASKRRGKYSQHFGIKHSKETLLKQSEAQEGDRHSGWKGGVTKLNIALYDTYGPQLEQFNFEEVRIYMWLLNGVVYKTLQVLCHESGCRKWFRPTLVEVKSRLRAFVGGLLGEHNFYCSPKCKTNCSTYHKQKYFDGQNDIPRTYSVSELKTWSREVLRRANFICACCGEPATIGHHKKSKIEFPEFALDPNNGIALCELCHMPIFHKGLNAPVYFVDKCR